MESSDTKRSNSSCFRGITTCPPYQMSKRHLKVQRRHHQAWYPVVASQTLSSPSNQRAIVSEVFPVVLPAKGSSLLLRFPNLFGCTQRERIRSIRWGSSWRERTISMLCGTPQWHPERFWETARRSRTSRLLAAAASFFLQFWHTW